MMMCVRVMRVVMAVVCVMRVMVRMLMLGQILWQFWAYWWLGFRRHVEVMVAAVSVVGGGRDGHMVIVHV